MKKNLLFKRRLCFQKAFMLILILISLQVSAEIPITKKSVQDDQPKKVTGTVTDNSGSPVAGATVVVKGTNNGTAADLNGEFILSNVKPDDVIVFSFIGMKTFEIKVGNQTMINVILESESISLDEVVAVGYSTQKRVTLTGSVASINNKELTVTKNENVLNMLTGKLPGVRVVQKSSAPGAYNTLIDIRGMGNPLFVIDGIPRDQDYFARMDPQEIENISTLKDGSAAIYGVRAGNGVILVTTKSGTSQNGKVDITYSATYSAQQFLSVPHGINALEYMTLRNEKVFQDFQKNYLVRQTPTFSQTDMQPYIDGKPSYDWVNAVFRKTTPEQQHNISINGGSEKLRYFMSLSYANQQGSFKSGGFYDNKWNFRSNVDAQITKRLAARVSIGGILDQTHKPTGASWDFYKSVWLERPDVAIYANDNPLYLNGDNSLYAGHNMVAEVSPDIVGYDINKQRKLNGTLQLSYDIPGIKGLTAKGLYDYAMDLPDNTTYKRPYSLFTYNPGTDVYSPSPRNVPSYAQRSANFNYSNDMQLGLYYKNQFGKHSVNSFLIFEEAYSNWDSFSAYRELKLASEYLFAGEALNQLAQGGIPGDRSSQSLIGSLTYDFSGKYLFDFKFRYDASSRFPQDGQWGLFPSFSAGWRLSEENFMKNNLPVISNLKLRASYGEMGDDNYKDLSNYPPTMGYNLSTTIGWMFNNILNMGVEPQPIPKPLTWYRIKMYNIGLDFGILQNKLSGSFELYRRDRSGVPSKSTAVVPGTVGAILPLQNLNADRNFGWELSLDYNNTIRDFSYSVGGQISATRSMRTDWLESTANNQYDYWRNRTSGRYNNIWWGDESAHMFTSLEEIRNYNLPMGQGSTPGDWINNDWNQDGVINAADDHPIATNGLPLFNYGINLGASWKGVDLTALFQGAYGVYAQYGELLTSPLPFDGQNTLSYFLDRWHPADPNADYFSPATEWISGYYPVTGHNDRNTGSNAVQNASYLRLKTLELGYSLPKNLLSKVGIKSLRIYLSGYNLLTFTKMKYLDPERMGNIDPTIDEGKNSYVDYYSYPVNRIYTLGAVLKF